MVSPKYLVSIQLLTSLLFLFPPLLQASLLLLGRVPVILANSVAGVPAVEGTPTAAEVSIVADVSAESSVSDVGKVPAAGGVSNVEFLVLQKFLT